MVGAFDHSAFIADRPDKVPACADGYLHGLKLFPSETDQKRVLLARWPAPKLFTGALGSVDSKPTRN